MENILITIWIISSLISVPLIIVGLPLPGEKSYEEIEEQAKELDNNGELFDDITSTISRSDIWIIILMFLLGCIPILNVVFAIMSIDFIKDYVKNREKIKAESILQSVYKIKFAIKKENNPQSIKISDELSIIIDKYKKIISQELYRNMAIDRMKYVITLLEECIKDESTEDNADNILEMLQVTGDFFDELLQQISNKEKIIRDNKNTYMREQITKFNEVTKSMNEGLKEVREVETVNKNL